MNVPAECVRTQIAAILAAWGMRDDLARTTTEAMVQTDLSGVDSHGIAMLTDYEASRAKGKLNLNAEPTIVRENLVTALVDAGAGLGHPAAARGMEIAIAKAKSMSVGVVSVFNSHHFGAAGHYARMAARHGFIGLVASATRSINTVPTRGTVPLLGTNPIAFAAPARRNRPFVLDMATSTSAANKVRVYALKGKPLPAGWVLDGAGTPVTDAKAATDTLFGRAANKGGGLTPLGGTAEMSSHKGYGLAMMVHILGGVLSGASFSPLRVRTQRPSDPDNLGHFFMALDPKAFRPDGAFEDDLDDVIDVLHGTPPIDPALPVLVAGDPEEEARELRMRVGIPIPDALAEELRGVCERCGAPYVLDVPA
jgi:LDH2 family malate/lactate/ureidoglycolate dehydrogenase